MLGAERATRRGAVLLEALVALMILAVAGVSLIALAADSARTVEHVRQSEAELRAATTFMDAVALWPRADLDRHLGDRAERAWNLRIDRPTPTLYVAVLRDSAGTHEILRTMLYRPEAHASP